MRPFQTEIFIEFSFLEVRLFNGKAPPAFSNSGSPKSADDSVDATAFLLSLPVMLPNRIKPKPVQIARMT